MANDEFCNLTSLLDCVVCTLSYNSLDNVLSGMNNILKID